MWINMNETIESISAILVGVVFGGIVFVLPALIIRGVYRKLRASKAKASPEAPAESAQNEPAVVHKPTNPRRAAIILIALTLLAVFWALAIGFTMGVFSHLLYIVFLFPFVMGINNGKMIADVIEKAKLRRISQLVFLSAVSAVVMYGTFHYTRYLGFVAQISFEIFEDFSEATEEENLAVAKAFADYALQEETGHTGFVGYMLYRASEGVSISRLTRSSGLNLGPILTWLYWLLELGIILGVTIQKGKPMIGKAFCEACGHWYGSEKHLGGTATANESFLLDLIGQKDFSGLGNLIEKNAEVPSLEVYFQGCQVCGNSQSELVIRRASQNAKGLLQFSDASKTTLQPAESVSLLSQFSFSGD
jgi:hypothetical protein